MWRNYLTVGVRALAKNQTYSFITIFGLAIGMAACLMILLFVRYELSYDRWLAGSDDAYQFQSWYTADDNGSPELQLQMTAYQAGRRLLKDFPQVDKVSYLLAGSPVLLKDGQASPTKDFVFADSNLLDVIQLPVARGDRNALSRIGTAVMTQSEATKRFGTDDVVGKTLTIISKGVRSDYQVGAVLKDLPRNSHLKFSTIARVDIATYMANEPQFLDCWGCQGGWVYARLKPGTDPKTIEAGLPAWEKRNIPDQPVGDDVYNDGDRQDWRLVNLKDVHLGKAQGGAMTPGNDQRTITTFAVVGLLILAMAVINFVNLTTARASMRAREVALRKTLGANRRQLILQFLGESMIVAILAMLLALAFVEISLPGLANFLEADLGLSYFGADGALLPVVGLTLAVGILGGLYPAFYLSRFQPASVLKANRSSSETPGSGRLRTALVVSQFAVSIGLIICTAVVYGQTVYARTSDPGFKRENIIQVDNLSRYQLLGRGEAIAERVKRVPGVVSVGRTAIGIATQNSNNTGVLIPGRTEQVTIGTYFIDTGFFNAMGIKLLAGRFYDNRRMDDMTLPFPTDTAAEEALVARGGNVVINASAAKRMGYDRPADAIGKTLKAGIVFIEGGLVPMTIVGVVADSRFRSLHVPLDAILFINTNSGHSDLIVRYTGDPAAVNAKVKQAWESVTNDVPYEAKFSEDIVHELYKADDARAIIFAGFAALSIIVGCLGLFGLAAFTAERRTKEIGIRKVLGAKTQDIVRLLVWQFSKPVVIANIIAWPIAWWLMRDWLNTFSDRIALGPQWFIGAGLLALLIATATIISHALRIARANPIHALRYE